MRLDSLANTSSYDLVDVFEQLGDRARVDILAHFAREGRAVVAGLAALGCPVPLKLYMDIDDTMFARHIDDSFPVWQVSRTHPSVPGVQTRVRSYVCVRVRTRGCTCACECACW